MDRIGCGAEHHEDHCLILVYKENSYMEAQEIEVSPQANTKEVTVYVNGRPKVIEKKTYSFIEIVRLAYSSPQSGSGVEYTVTYSKGPGSKKEGTLIEGQTVKVKEGMIFNVTETNKS